MSQKILVVEDSPDNMKLFRTLLVLKGHEVTGLAGGEGLLEVIGRTGPDLVLMDIQLPGKDGYALLEEIRRSPHQGLRVLALTAHALPEEVRKSFDAGCTAHLTKPIRKATLIAAIEEHTMGVVRVLASLADLVPGFLDGRRRDIDAIAAALERSDYDDVRILGHNMKGSGAGYGFNRITEIGTSLEQAAGRRVPSEIRAQSAELVRYLDGLHVVYE